MTYFDYRMAAEEKARLALKRSGHSGVPVDPTIVAKALGLKVLQMPLDDELSGMAFIEGKDRLIIVNANQHLHRRRFTVAHELGHHQLGHISDDVHVDTQVFHRNARSRTGEDRHEVEANAFAAELLMPRSEVKKYGRVDVLDDSLVGRLAKDFRVSHSAMAIRIENLNDFLNASQFPVR